MKKTTKENTTQLVINTTKGEVSGAFLLGLVQSFYNLHILPHDGMALELDYIEPEEWYPYSMLMETLETIEKTFPTSSSIFFRAGIHFLHIWYHHGPGKTMIHSGLDWLYANSDSQGYNSVVRGGDKNEIGWCLLKSIDEKLGIAVYENVMALSLDYVKGVFYGGCILFDDMEFVTVEGESVPNHHNNAFNNFKIIVRFRLKSKNTSQQLESRLNALQLGENLDLTCEEIKSLVWRHKGLQYRKMIDESYHNDINVILSNAITESQRISKELQREISERKAALVALEKAQQSLVQTEKMAALGGLVAGISHEINTPVGVILMSATHFDAQTKAFSKRYEEGEMSGTDLENFFDISKQAAKLMTINSQRAADLINSFKQVAVDQTSSEKRKFILKHYIDEILLSLHPKLKKTPLTVEVNCPENLQLNSYAGAVSQVLTNLVMNSLTHAYSPQQAGTLRIHVNLLPNDFVELIYSDDGRGIPDELQAQVFDPFFTTQRGQGGSGLGLHIVYNIIHQTLKGELKMDSVLNEGTTFTLCFPRISTN
jgi:signal transduction histidine kinase